MCVIISFRQIMLTRVVASVTFTVPLPSRSARDTKLESDTVPKMMLTNTVTSVTLTWPSPFTSPLAKDGVSVLLL